MTLLVGSSDPQNRLRNDLYCVEWDVKLYYTYTCTYTVMVTTEHKYETVHDIPNGAIFNDLELPQTQISRARHYSTSKLSKYFE